MVTFPWGFCLGINTHSKSLAVSLGEVKMASKKKSKGNKLARMSEEEKIRYLQHRAAIEEEARRRKEQLIATFMKNKLKREEVFSRLNMAKINQEWRQTLRQIKCIELKQDLEDLFKWFDYSANKRNVVIEMLLDDLDEAEAQYSRIHFCHSEIIERLIKLHRQRTGYFHSQFRREKNQVQKKAEIYFKDITECYKGDEEHLQATLYKMEETNDEKMAAMNSNHVSKVDEIRNNMLTELENVKLEKEIKIEKIWEKLEIILKEYWEQTEDRRRQYLIMREADYDNCRQIFDNNNQIDAITELLSSLREELSTIQNTSTQQFVEYKKNKETARQLLFTLKKKVKDENESDKEKLTFMNAIASKTTQDLQKILSKGEEILQLNSLCMKLETLNEKICPEGLDKTQLTEEEEKEVQNQSKEYLEPLAEEKYNSVIQLDGFWKRYNRVLLEKEALALHYKSLQNEQKQLVTVIKNYLSAIVVKKPERKVSGANGVRFYRQRPRSFAATQRKTAYSAITCIEATQSPSIRKIIAAQTGRL